jgi:hypothetical protein
MTALVDEVLAPFRLRRLERKSPRAAGVARRVRRERLSYLEPRALCELAEAAHAQEQAGLPGAFVEAGCALGGSAMVIAAAKRPARPLFVYDVFGMIPAPTQKDGRDVHERYQVILSGGSGGIGGGRYYGYETDLYGKVRDGFGRMGLDAAENNVLLVKGRYEETLWPPYPVALAHVDCDWYESVWTCLSRIVPALAPGGLLVVDDYDRWSGCRKAVDAYFAKNPGPYRFLRKARLHIKKTA